MPNSAFGREKKKRNFSTLHLLTLNGLCNNVRGVCDVLHVKIDFPWIKNILASVATSRILFLYFYHHITSVS